MNMDENYIKQLIEILNYTGWSQQKLAGELDVTFAALNRWLNNKAIPHKSTQKIIYSLYKKIIGILPISQDSIKRALFLLDNERKKHKKINQILASSKSLREDFLLELTYNSNAIEGSALTKKETEAIIFDKAKIPDKAYSEHLEATNHAAAIEMIFNGDFLCPISESLIKELHRVIMQGVRPDAGQYSKHHRAIRGVDLRLPSPEDIPEEMAALIKKTNKMGKSPLEHITEMHASFEAIHPFGDGNGRVGRLIMIIQLLSEGYPPCIIENSKKSDYYEALEFAQKKSMTHLVMFLLDSVQRGYSILKKHRL